MLLSASGGFARRRTAARIAAGLILTQGKSRIDEPEVRR
jgi:hypothetical protein